MKRVIILILATSFLASCNNSKIEKTLKNDSTIPKELFNQKKETTTSTQSKSDETKIKRAEITLEEVAGPPLQKVGQWFQDTDNQRIELLRINTQSDSSKLDGLEIFVKDVKVSKYIYNEIPDNLSDDIISEFMSDKLELYSLQISYRIINMTPNTYNYSGISSYTTNNGKKFDLYLDNLLASIDTEIVPNSESELILAQTYITEKDYNELTSIDLDLGSFYNETQNSSQEFHESLKFNLL